MSTRPPRLASWLLRRILDPRHREYILDDLVEDYRLRQATAGRLHAYRWYWSELVRSIRPSVDARTRANRRSPYPHDGHQTMDILFADLKQSARRLLKTPGFTVTALVTLALGIGANVAIFTMVNGIVLRPLPYPDADRLVSIRHTAPGLGVEVMEMSMGTYVHYVANANLIESAGLLVNAGVNLTGDGDPERLEGASINHTFLPTLGVEPILGRTFTAEDDRVDTPSNVLIGHALWQQRFGGDPNVLGKLITLQGEEREIIGVMPAGFAMPTPRVAVYLPMKVPESEIRFGGFFRQGIARLKPGVTPEQFAAELEALIPSLAAAYDVPAEMLENAQVGVLIAPLKERFLGNIERPLTILLGTVGFVLLIACANVANLFLVRAESRNKEVAIRRALGSSRLRLSSLFMLEAALLGGAGGLGGLGVAWLGVRAVQLSGVPLPRIDQVSIDARVIAFTALAALLSTLLFGAIPALRLARRDLDRALNDESRGTTMSRGRHRARNLLVGAQIALALMLLVGSALMAQSSWRLAHVDPGYRTDNLLTAQVLLPDASYPTEADVVAFYNRVVERVGALPGVISAAASSELPLRPGMGRWDALYVEGAVLDANTLPPAVIFRYVTAGYFDTLGIPLMRGRGFEPTDAVEGNAAALVSESIARDFWPDGDALGGRAWQDLPPDEAPAQHYTVVGIVGDTLDQDLAEQPTSIFYFPVLEQGEANLHWVPSQVAVIARTDGDTLAQVDAVRRAIWSIDPNLPIADIRTIGAIVRESTLNSRFTMALLVLAAAIALFLGGIGLYGTISYLVSQRTREIGVRMALGAAEADVASMVLREGTRVAVAGLIVGLVAAFSLTRVLDSLLYEVSATDPATYIAMAALLLCVAMLATYIPARRAARLDPLEGLRAE